MYGKAEVRCRICGRKEMVDIRELEHQGRGCCRTTMEHTGVEEYDDEFARESNERGRHDER
ncbi:MAG TPA: hypothetical protein VNE39_28835 [Planctomycetota bacterium]|nr:hypothetical protein [Planctomycetota bacterium]